MSTLVNQSSGPIPLMDPTLFLTLAPCMDMNTPPLKKPRLAASLLLRHEPEKPKAVAQKRVASMDTLPDECLYEIVRRLPSKKDRGIASCVSRRWLMLLGTIPAERSRSELPDLNLDPVVDLNSTASDHPDVTCSMEGKDATDARLAAVAIREGVSLGKLAIRSGDSPCRVTGLGLKAVARRCPQLRTLLLWDVPLLGDDGLVEIADGCSVLEKLDLSHCPSISDDCIVAIAEKCRNLKSLSLESCVKITNKGLQEMGRLCTKLESISITNCPLIGDEGICRLISSNSSTLRMLKLQGLPISDVSLGVVGYYGTEISDLVLVDLPNVAERGFWVMGSTFRLRKLSTFKVTSCDGLTDLGIESVAKGCPDLKHISLRKAPGFTDSGLKSLARAAASFENLMLEECNSITLPGVIAAFADSCRNLRTIAIARCAGIRDVPANYRVTGSCGSVQTLAIRSCRDLGDTGIATIAKLFPNLQSIDLRSLPKLTDAALVRLVEGRREAALLKVRLSNCLNLTDASVAAIAKIHGSTMETLSIDGCRKVTDAGLFNIASYCSRLANLDVSSTGVTDAGIAGLGSTHMINLKVLSIANCSKVSIKSLGVFVNMGQRLVGLNLQNCVLMSSSAIASLQEKMWWCDVLC